jgi:GPH family glycoside/pentoside/hexuronide:cation symporter
MDNLNNEAPTLREEKKVPFFSAAWLAGADGTCALLCSFIEGATLNSFYIYNLGLSKDLANLVWVIFGIWNAINDPIYGFIADRTKSKLGRRIPWIRYGAPLYGLFFALSWLYFPSMSGNQGFLTAMLLISLFFFDTLYTAVASAIYVMPFEMAVTNKARSPIFILKIVFSLISTGIPFVLNSKYSDIVQAIGAQNFCFVMMGVGVVGAIIIFASTFFYKEHGYVQDEVQPKFWDGLKQTFKNKSFLLFLVISWTVIFAQTALMDGLTPVWPMWNNQPGWMGDNSMLICAGAMVIGAVVSLLLFIKFRDKFGVRNCSLVMCGSMAFGCFLGAFVGNVFWLLAVAFLFIGVGFAGGMYLVPILNGDVMDKDEIDNGSRREGVYAGVNSLVTKPAQSIATAVFNSIFAAYGFDKDIKISGTDNVDFAAQSASAKQGVFMAWMLVTAILLVLSFVAMYFYPLRGKEWDKQKAVLSVQHVNKEVAYEQAMLKKNEEAEQAASDKK